MNPINCAEITKKFLKYNDGEILYKDKKFQIITDFIKISFDKFSNVNVFDENVIKVFKMIDDIVGDNKDNSFVKTFTNKNNKPCNVLKIKVAKSLPKNESKMFENIDTKEFKLLISLHPKNEKYNSITAYIVRLQSRDFEIVNEFNDFKF